MSNRSRRRLIPASICILSVILGVSSGRAGPTLSMDPNEETIQVPIGTVSSNTLTIGNDGDSTLTWTLSDRFRGKVVKDFASPWTSARSMRYDSTRDCLWLSYYYDSNVKKVSTSDGSVLGTKNMGTACTRPYGIEIENGFLWAIDYENTRFVKFNLDNMSVSGQTPFPSGWTYAYGLAIGDGNWYATDSADRNDIYRLNPSTGAIQQTYDEVEYFYYSNNHISYGAGGVWYGAYYAPKNEMRKFDPVSGKIRRVIEMPDWYASTYIRDQSFDGTEGRIWVLTYRHDYHVSGQYKSWIHLLDVGLVERLSQSVDSGSVAAGGSQDVGILLDANGAVSGIHRVSVTVQSDGGAETKPYVFVVHAPGANGAPIANAGPDQTLDATEPTMEITLDASVSSDPNGDEMVYTWTEGGVEIATGVNPTIDLAPGVHDITLSIDDYRGGTDTDTVRITLRAPDIEVDDCFVAHPVGGGTAVGTVTIRNSGDKTLNWSVSDAVSLDQSSIIKEFAIGWVSSYSTYAYPYTMTYDNSRDCLWVGYYYDNEIGKINASNGSTITTKSVPDGRRVYALDMEGSDIWTADYYEKKFRKYDPDTMSNTQTINNPWGTGNGPCSMARDSGEFYASQYYAYDICKLDAGSGAVQKTHDVGERQYYYNHHDAINGKVWYTRYNAPKTRIHCMDGASGNLLRSLDMGHWDESGQIYDLSFQSVTQCWMLTYNVKGDTKRMAHLVDVSAADKFSKSATSGTTAAGGTSTFTVSLDTTGLSIGWHTLRLTFSSDDPDEPTYEKDVIFIIHEDAPNNPPTANAGPDVTRDIPGVTAPFILDLSGSGSSDPDGDTLFSSWTMNGEPVEMTDKGLIELGAGAHTFELTVDDLRGGVDTDSFTMTVNAHVVPDASPQYQGPTRNGVYPMADGWLENWPPIERWRTVVGGSYGSLSISDGRVYRHGGKKTWCLDISDGRVLWTAPDLRLGDNPSEEYCRNGAEMPAVDETQVYVYQSDSTAMCYDKITGERKWAVPTHTLWNSYADCGRGASPLIEGDLAVFGGVALNKRTGEFINGGCGSSAHNAISSFDYNGRRWLCREGKTYDILTGLSSPFGSVGSSSGRGDMQPTWYGDRFYSVTGIKLIGASGYLWRDTSTYGTMYQIPIPYEGYGYTTRSTQYKGGSGTLKCARLSDGALAWSGPSIASISIAGDKLLLGTGGGIAIAKTGPGGYDTEGRAIFKMETAGPQSYHAGIVPLGQRLYVPAGKYIICLDCAYSAPALENRAGAWDGIAGRAVMRGKFVNTGGRTPVQGYVYWGRVDGGTNAAQWEGCTPLGEMTPGLFEKAIADVPVDSVIYYRCYAENSEGGTWATGPSERISTFRTPCVEGEVGLLLHWPLDESSGLTAADASGYDHHGVLRTKFKGNEWTNGVAGNALYFSQSGQGLTYLGAFSETLREYWSVAFWVRAEPDVSGNLFRIRELVETGNSGGGKSLTLSWSSGAIALSKKAVTPVLNDNQWHHVALIRNGGTTYVYADGAKESQVGSQASPYRYMAIGQIGTDTSHANGMKFVSVDDVRVYNRALSGPEVKALTCLYAGTETDAGGPVESEPDDAEEALDGTVTLDGEELNLGMDGTGDGTVVGLRFPGLDIPNGAAIASAHIQFSAGDVPVGVRKVLAQGDLVSYAAEDNGGTATVMDGGRTVLLEGNTWKAHPIPAYTVTSNTMLEVEFSSTNQCEVQGIGLESQTRV